MRLMLSCKDASALIIKREDQTLCAGETVVLKFHLFICATCPKFENQILVMRKAMDRWRNYTDDAEDTQRLSH
jgi:hypothetical protein